VNVGTRNLQVIHQFDDVLGTARPSGLWLVALTVIPIVDGDNAMIFCKSRREAGPEPHPLGRIRVPMDQHDP
jgi:hypothetical protein